MDEIKHLRQVRSFVLREGRMTDGQKKAYDRHMACYGLDLNQGQINLAQVFGRTAPCVLEIGFGMGQSLVLMAQNNPHIDYIGIEVHRPGVGALLKAVSDLGLSNVRVYNTDGIEVLKQAIPDGMLSGLQLFFPDPWHKKRHHKRRIVQPEFIELLRQKLAMGGFFHLATDWQPYAEYMLEAMSVAPGFSNKFGPNHYAPDSQGRPSTKFEVRGQKLGHGVWDLVFERVA